MFKNMLMLVALSLPFSSHAALIFFGEDLNPNTSTANSDLANSDFLATLLGAGTENFESLSNGTSAPITVDFGIAGTATLTGNGNILTGTGAGRFPTSGNNLWNTNETFTITFSQAISAFGFFGTDIGDIGGQVTMNFANGASSNSYTVNNTVNAPNGSLLYWGIVDTANPFTSITFGNTNNSDWFGFDDMTIAISQQVGGGKPIPEPSILALFAIALLSFRLRKAK